MKKRLRKILIGGLIFICSTTNLLAVDPNGYTNGSKPANANASKIINYIQSKKQANAGTVFCIGEDKITYYESFFDEERDYYNLAFSNRLLSNLSLSEQQKQVNPVNLQIKYEHNPSVYDNPVTKSGLSGVWANINVSWDSVKNKWKLSDPTNAILFETPTDDKRGEWTIYVKGTDSTGKSIFDKETIGFSKFRVHKAPIPVMSFSETSTTATLSAAGSYDADYQYSKNTSRNVAGDRSIKGIKEFYWEAKIGGTWVDLGTGYSVTFNKNGQAVSDYRLTVEDYDGAFASISKTSLVLEKPIVDFEFKVGGYSGTTTNYAYRGNAGNEKLYVNRLITWRDESYSASAYATSGTQTERWTALKTGDNVFGFATFTTQILQNKYASIINGNTISVELEAKNKFDYYATKQKSLLVQTVQLQDLTGTQRYAYDPTICTVDPCGFTVGSQGIYIVNQTNSSIRNDELTIRVVSALGTHVLNYNGTNFTAYMTIPTSNKALWDTVPYTINVYSKRTNELLHTQDGSFLVHTPVTVKGAINGKTGQDTVMEVNSDEPIVLTATTNMYSEKTTVNLPIATVNSTTGEVYPANTDIQMTRLSNTNWTLTLNIGEDLSDDRRVNALFKTIAYNGRDIATDVVGMDVATCKLLNFRVVQIRDLQLKSLYEKTDGTYKDIPMAADLLAVNALTFNRYSYAISSLTKGYQFYFEIDSRGFNEEVDRIVIEPSFYSILGSSRYSTPRSAYWVDSNKKVWAVGEGGHEAYKTITLTKANRTLTGAKTATWRGSYFIPGTTFLTPQGTSTASAQSQNLKSDVIVDFHIVGYKGSVAKFDYNLKQWPKEVTTSITPYQIGDVIRYGQGSNLDDLEALRTH